MILNQCVGLMDQHCHPCSHSVSKAKKYLKKTDRSFLLPTQMKTSTVYICQQLPQQISYLLYLQYLVKITIKWKISKHILTFCIF